MSDYWRERMDRTSATLLGSCARHRSRAAPHRRGIGLKTVSPDDAQGRRNEALACKATDLVRAALR